MDEISIYQDMQDAFTKMAPRFQSNANRLRDMLKSPHGDEPNAHEVDLITQMIRWNPRERITIEEALKSPLFEAYEKPSSPDPKPYEAFDKSAFPDATKAREYIWEMFLEYHPEVKEVMETLEAAADQQQNKQQQQQTQEQAQH